MDVGNRDTLRDQLLAALEGVALQHDIDIVDVEVVGSQKSPTVRVRIDHADEDADPITLDEVSAETAWISELLDEMDPIAGAFTLEVSSPGLSRPLRKERDFVRFAGSDVSVTLEGTSGRLRYTGRLEGMEDGRVCVTTDEGAFSWLPDEIRSCKIKPDFGDAKGTPKNAKNKKAKR